MTHGELVTVAERWLRTRRNHPVVLTDVRCNAVSEQPDVIGWTNAGVSTLVECKVSRADFLRDEGKRHRRVPNEGMGFVRWYLAPAGVIGTDELPSRWGLLIFVRADRHPAVLVNARPFYEREESHERVLLVQALRRATEGWGRRMFGEGAPAMTDGDPHPTAARIIRDLRGENARLRAKLRKVG